MQYIVAVQKYGLKSVYCIHVFMASLLYHSCSPYSVGIEDMKDLIQDLQQALDKIWHAPILSWTRLFELSNSSLQ